MKFILDEGAYEPTRGHEFDAGLDLRTPIDFWISPHRSYVIDTGVHIQLPKYCYGKLESKSGLHVNDGIVCLGGVIDTGYTGSIKVKLYNLGDYGKHFNAGDKIVQLIINSCIIPDIEYVDKFEETERGDNGFGSTGR